MFKKTALFWNDGIPNHDNHDNHDDHNNHNNHNYHDSQVRLAHIWVDFRVVFLHICLTSRVWCSRAMAGARDIEDQRGRQPWTFGRIIAKGVNRSKNWLLLSKSTALIKPISFLNSSYTVININSRCPASKQLPQGFGKTVVVVESFSKCQPAFKLSLREYQGVVKLLERCGHGVAK